MPYISAEGEVRWLERYTRHRVFLCEMRLPCLVVERTELHDFPIECGRGPLCYDSVDGSPHLVGSSHGKKVFDLKDRTVRYLENDPVIYEGDYNACFESTRVCVESRRHNGYAIAGLAVKSVEEDLCFLLKPHGIFAYDLLVGGAKAHVYVFGNLVECLFLYEPKTGIYMLRVGDLLAKWNAALEATGLPRDLCKLIAQYTSNLPVHESSDASDPVIIQIPASEGSDHLRKCFALAEAETVFRDKYKKAEREVLDCTRLYDAEYTDKMEKRRLRWLRYEIRQIEKKRACARDYVERVRSERLERLKKAQDYMNHEILGMKRSLEEAYDDAGLERDTDTRPADEPVAKRTRATKERNLMFA